MIPVSTLATGIGTVSTSIKGRGGGFSGIPRPVISWNITSRCNLFCAHCYIEAGPHGLEGLSREEAVRVVENIAELGSPMIIFTGGEPLMRRIFSAWPRKLWRGASGLCLAPTARW